jgi:thioredoxin 1
MSQEVEINRVSIEQSKGPLVIEFGASWCSHCQAAQTIIARALINYSKVKHIRVEDGKGKSLGRSYKIKLWPTLVFINNGIEVARLVRPNSSQMIVDALNVITTTRK